VHKGGNTNSSSSRQNHSAQTHYQGSAAIHNFMPSICAAHQVVKVRKMNREYKQYIIQMNNIIHSWYEAIITSLYYFKNVLLLINILCYFKKTA